MQKYLLNQTIQIPKFEIPEVTIHKVHYQTNKVIGQGKNATIYLATDTTNHRLVALKAIELEDDVVQADFIRRELECLTLLETFCQQYVLCYIDSDVVTIKSEDEYGTTKTKYYIIITKFLEDYITWKEFKKKYPEKTKEVKKNIKIAIEFIHNKKVYHGDLHDENIMIHPETLDVRIIDFGYCQINPKQNLYPYDYENIKKK